MHRLTIEGLGGDLWRQAHLDPVHPRYAHKGGGVGWLALPVMGQIQGLLFLSQR